MDACRSLKMAARRFTWSSLPATALKVRPVRSAAVILSLASISLFIPQPLIEGNVAVQPCENLIPSHSLDVCD
ncbi:hypothetical protein [Agrobacterium pusense]|uniref:hypothetical protein n=1 Tax=Agrobacterium pusense TaxID=648995 RepID=UPI001AED0954|nr:hypothetical protein [Agrobacterium pusense]